MKKKSALLKSSLNTRSKIIFPHPHFYRPTWVEINHANLKHNFEEISKLLPKNISILSVVKANGYGHGMIPISKTLARCGAKFFGITSVEEALALKKSGIKTPALILGNIYPFINLEIAIKNQTRITIASLESARMCDYYARKLKKKIYAHAKIDTGMNRIGVSIHNALPFIKKISGYSSIVLEGLYTHFSGSAEDPDFTRKQLMLFSNLISEIRSQNIHIPFIHCANSAAIIKYPESHFTLVRPGISLYGFMPCKTDLKIELKPVLSWKSRIVFLKNVPDNSPVSYAGTFVTKRASKIATAAFGYADGFRRALSNKSFVLVNGQRVPTVGRITMDMTMIDVTDLPNVQVGDEVVIIGNQGSQTLSAKELADWAGTSPYEIFCDIDQRVPRIHLT